MRTLVLILGTVATSLPQAVPDSEILILDDNVRAQPRQGLGGRQKIGFARAIHDKFDFVAVLRAEQIRALIELPSLLTVFQSNPNLGCVLGVPPRPSTMNRALSFFQNRLADVRLRTWYAACRVYSTRALAKIAFALNTNGSHFDTEVLLQLIGAGFQIGEAAVPVKVPCVAPFSEGRNALKAALKYKLQKWNLFYDVRFHPEVVFGSEGQATPSVYHPKIDSRSPHSILFQSPDMVPNGSRVLDVGSASGYIAEELVRRKNCRVLGVDVLPPSQVGSALFEYRQLDLETQLPELVALVQAERFDLILMLDILEHMAMPERLLLQLSSLRSAKAPRLICSTANVAFIVVRLMLLFGHFNYGQKGILDITHKRLFSLHTFRNLLEQTGYVIEQQHYFPFPFRELGFSGWMAGVLEKINLLLIKIRPRLFAYQIMLEAVPLSGMNSSVTKASES